MQSLSLSSAPLLDTSFQNLQKIFKVLFQLRRSDHRRGFFNGRNFCLDIVTSDGTLIGTTGFREVEFPEKCKTDQAHTHPKTWLLFIVKGEGDEKARPVERRHCRVGRNYPQVGIHKIIMKCQSRTLELWSNMASNYHILTNAIDRNHQRKGICKEAYRACEQVNVCL